jgi:hypothetical protein
LLAAWLIALAAIAVPHPEVMFFPWSFLLFPGGLVGWLHRAGLCCGDERGYYAILGWMIYVPLSIALLVIDDKRILVRLFVLLCALLALNVVGCHLEMNARSA